MHSADVIPAACVEADRGMCVYVRKRRRPDDLHTFQVLPRRWVVERTLAWITRCRRTVRDYERLPGHHETMVHWAMTITMTRRLARRRQRFNPALPRAPAGSVRPVTTHHLRGSAGANSASASCGRYRVH